MSRKLVPSTQARQTTGGSARADREPKSSAAVYLPRPVRALTLTLILTAPWHCGGGGGSAGGSGVGGVDHYNCLGFIMLFLTTVISEPNTNKNKYTSEFQTPRRYAALPPQDS